MAPRELTTDHAMTLRKNSRKRFVSRNRPGNTKRPYKTKLSTSDNMTFRFLDLPAELRGKIYDQTLSDSSLVLSRNRTRDLVSTSALARVSRQTRCEFLPLAIPSTPVVSTKVKNWDFGHIINFLNRISDDELDRFSSNRRIVVDFWFSGENADPAGLMRWLDRFGSERRGSCAVFEYKCTKLDHALQNWKVAGFRACTVGGRAGFEQFEKIEEQFTRQYLSLADRE